MSFRTGTAKPSPLPRSRLNEVLRAGVDAGFCGEVADDRKAEDTGVRGVVNGGLMPISPLPAPSVDMPDVYNPYQSVLDARNTYNSKQTGPPRALWNALPKEIVEKDDHGNDIHFERILGDLVLRKIVIKNENAPLRGTIFFDGSATNERATEWRDGKTYIQMTGPRGKEQIEKMAMLSFQLYELGKAFPPEKFDTDGIAQFNEIHEIYKTVYATLVHIVDSSDKKLSAVDKRYVVYQAMTFSGFSIQPMECGRLSAFIIDINKLLGEYSSMVMKKNLGFKYVDGLNIIKDAFTKVGPNGETVVLDLIQIDIVDNFENSFVCAAKTFNFGKIPRLVEKYNDGTSYTYKFDGKGNLFSITERKDGPQNVKPNKFDRPFPSWAFDFDESWSYWAFDPKGFFSFVIGGISLLLLLEDGKIFTKERAKPGVIIRGIVRFLLMMTAGQATMLAIDRFGP